MESDSGFLLMLKDLDGFNERVDVFFALPMELRKGMVHVVLSTVSSLPVVLISFAVNPAKVPS